MEKNRSLMTVVKALGLSVFLGTSSHTPAEDSQLLIENATQATVLIKTHLRHGFIEDEEATDRWRGSGFLIDRENGWIMTNAHVAGYGDSALRVKFENQTKFTSAEKVFLDSKHDVAIIEIDSEKIPETSIELKLDCEYSLKRGNRVFSLGHPEDQDFTVSFGVLSGNKDFHVDGSYYTTDLVTEPGSSGGPVMLAKTGQVIGMTTAGFDDSDIGFITKSSDICPIFTLVKDGKNPARPRFDFQTMIVDQELSPRIGAIFDESLPLLLGDEVLSWNNNLWDPKEHGDLADAMRGYEQESVHLVVFRDGKEVQVNVPVKVGSSAHKKDWIYFTGLTITEDNKTDARFVMGNKTTPMLNIETIDTDFNDTEDIEFYRGVDIYSIGDVEGMDLRTLYELLANWPADMEIKIIARVFDWTPESYSYLMTHSFKVKDLDCSWCSQNSGNQ
jgi:S1-C subfamily serine protease